MQLWGILSFLMGTHEGNEWEQAGFLGDERVTSGSARQHWTYPPEARKVLQERTALGACSPGSVGGPSPEKARQGPIRSAAEVTVPQLDE
jgi:hypothetical protein